MIQRFVENEHATQYIPSNMYRNDKIFQISDVNTVAMFTQDIDINGGYDRLCMIECSINFYY